MPHTGRVNEALIGKLARVPLFSGLDESALARIAGIVTEFDVAPGHVLIRGGDPGAGLFLIEEGTVKVTIRGREVELGPGEVVGELALLDERGTHAGRAQAKTAVRACAIDRDHFIELLGAEPAIALVLLRVLAHRLADQIEPH